MEPAASAKVPEMALTAAPALRQVANQQRPLAPATAAVSESTFGRVAPDACALLAAAAPFGAGAIFGFAFRRQRGRRCEHTEALVAVAARPEAFAQQRARPFAKAKAKAKGKAKPSWQRRKHAQLYRELAGDEEEAAPPPVTMAASTLTRLTSGAQKPEVLSPAGGWPQLRAAVRNGADAVYFGLDLGLNARARAANFTSEELPDVMSYLHERGVKAYVTVNTLVFDDEIFGDGSKALEVLRVVREANVDALIMQDIGLALACRRLFPDLPIHASTQMSVTSAPGARFAAQICGADRVVLGRELSLSEIAAVRKDAPGVEIEAFVHGALCVSYSGQCFSSEAWGGRSANRGQCAQACRLPYGLVRDGELVGLGDGARYLLSPQDLMALEHMPRLIEAGVSCFKIEGRLKGEEYVGLTTAAYRSAVDSAWHALRPMDESGEDEGQRLRQKASTAKGEEFKGGGTVLLADPEQRRAALAQVFARGQDADHDGLTPGFLEGSQHQRLVRGHAPKHRGVFAGTVTGFRAKEGMVVLRLSSASAAVPLQGGSGLSFERPYRGGPAGEDIWREDAAAGGFVGKLRRARDGTPGGSEIDSTEGLREGDEVAVYISISPDERGAETLRRLEEVVAVGDLVWRTKDTALEKKIHRLAMRGLPGMEVTVAVSGTEGEFLRVRLSDREGRVGEGCSDEVLTLAQRQAWNLRTLDKTLKLSPGGPPPDDGDAQIGFWRAGAGFDGGDGIDVSGLASDLFLPNSQVQRAKQRAAKDLLSQRLAKRPMPVPSLAVPEQVEVLCKMVNLGPPSSWLGSRSDLAMDYADVSPPAKPPKLTVLCRSREQADAILALEPGLIHELQLDFLEAQGLEGAVAAAKAAGVRVAACLPRVLKPGEDRLANFYARLGADALVVRSAGALQQLLCLEQSASSTPGSSRSDGDGATAAEHNGESRASKVGADIVGDFSLNAANTITAAMFLDLPGLRRLTPTHDLNVSQLCTLARGLGPERAARLEVVAHQHLPIFHTEHCVFCRFLTKGNDYRDCGHPCEKGSLHLRDASGRDHRVMADMGCRNTVFNAEAQSAAHDLNALAAAGVGFLRLELVDEPADMVAPLVQRYHGALRGTVAPGDLWDFVTALPDSNGRRQGLSRGSLDDSAWRERATSQLRPSAAAARSASAVADHGNRKSRYFAAGGGSGATADARSEKVLR